LLSHDEDVDAVLQAIRCNQRAVIADQIERRRKLRRHRAVTGVGFLFSQICKYLFSLFPLPKPKNDDDTVDLTK
jgi:hypothetical protein